MKYFPQIPYTIAKPLISQNDCSTNARPATCRKKSSSTCLSVLGCHKMKMVVEIEIPRKNLKNNRVSRN
jgi:hypothetical protein